MNHLEDSEGFNYSDKSSIAARAAIRKLNGIQVAGLPQYPKHSVTSGFEEDAWESGRIVDYVWE